MDFRLIKTEIACYHHHLCHFPTNHLTHLSYPWLATVQFPYFTKESGSRKWKQVKFPSAEKTWKMEVVLLVWVVEADNGWECRGVGLGSGRLRGGTGLPQGHAGERERRERE